LPGTHTAFRVTGLAGQLDVLRHGRNAHYVSIGATLIVTGHFDPVAAER